MFGGMDSDFVGLVAVFLFDTMVKATLLLAIVLAVVSLFGTRRAAWRSLLLQAGVVGMLLIPLGSLLLPNVRIPVLPSLARAPDPASAEGALTSPPGAVAAVSQEDSGESFAGSLRTGLLVLYGLGFSYMLIRLFRGALSALALRRNTQRVSAPDVLNRWRRWKWRLGIRGCVPLTCSGLVETPTQLGAMDPVVVLPHRLLKDTDGETLDMILVHELAHVRGHDCVFRLLSMVARAFYWPNPLAWLACRMLAEAQEQACDDCVVDATRDPGGYAGSLLDLAAGTQPGPALALGLEMARTPRVFGRVERVVKIGGKASGQIGGATSLVVTIALAGCAAGLGAVTAIPSSPERPEIPAPAAIQQTVLATPTPLPGRDDETVPQGSTTDRVSEVVTGGHTESQMAGASVPEVPETPVRTGGAKVSADTDTGERGGVLATLLTLRLDQDIQVRGSRGARAYSTAGLSAMNVGRARPNGSDGGTHDPGRRLDTGFMSISGQGHSAPPARRSDDWWIREQTHGMP